MRRPAGVIMSGILLWIIALLGVAVGGLALGASVFAHRPIIPRIPAVEVCSYLMVAFCVFCFWAAVDLLRMRRWTRSAMVPIGGIVFVCSSLAGAGLIWARQFAALLPSGPYSGEVQTGILTAVAICFLIALLGVWWMIYFCLARVRAAFGAGLPREGTASGNRVAS
jgi:hypothetical protein